MRTWSQRIVEWMNKGIDVYGYYNNDKLGVAPHDAQRMCALVSEGAKKQESKKGGAKVKGEQQIQQSRDELPEKEMKLPKKEAVSSKGRATKAVKK